MSAPLSLLECNASSLMPAGEHPLVGSTLSAFSQALAPLVAGPQRLFVLAGALPKQQLEPLQQLAAILERISQIQV